MLVIPVALLLRSYLPLLHRRPYIFPRNVSRARPQRHSASAGHSFNMRARHRDHRVSHLEAGNFLRFLHGFVDALGVRRPWRRSGLGLALLHQCFSAFYQRKTRTVKLMVDSRNLTGATRLYERAGMRVTQLHYTYEKELRPGKELRTQAIGK